MDRPALVSWYRRMHRRLLASGCCAAGLSLAGAGCSHFQSPDVGQASTTAAASTPASQDDSSAAELSPYGAAPATSDAHRRQPIIQASLQQVSQLPAVSPDQAKQPARAGSAAPHKPAPPAAPPRLPAAVAETATTVLPIGLDTVLHLAEDQNAQVGIARAKVRQAYAEKDVASLKWVPDVYIGTAWYRHEGGIQNEDGTLTHSSTGAIFAGGEMDANWDVKNIAYEQVNAQRKVWQQRGELSRVTSETLLDASNTYIDWLTARSGESVVLNVQDKLKDLLDRTQKLAVAEPALKVEVARIQAELDAQEQTLLHLRQQAAGAEAKLLYVLGLNPCSRLEPIDTKLLPFELIDATPPTCDLVAQALRTGPGVREMEGLLGLIQQSMERANGPGKYLPIFEMRMAEGAFGAGPGDDMRWDNRWDLCLQARWNLTGLLTANDRRRAADAQVQQANLAYQDLRGKLTAGVAEAREAILSGNQQIDRTERQIRNARQAYDLSNERYQQRLTPSATEVLLAIGTLARAQTNYLTVTNAYDKAQLRLMVLLGPGAVQCRPPVAPAPLQNAPHPGQ